MENLEHLKRLPRLTACLLCSFSAFGITRSVETLRELTNVLPSVPPAQAQQTPFEPFILLPLSLGMAWVATAVDSRHWRLAVLGGTLIQLPLATWVFSLFDRRFPLLPAAIILICSAILPRLLSRVNPAQPTLRTPLSPSPFRPAPLPATSSAGPQILRSESRAETRSEPQWTLTPTRTQATVLHCEILNAAQLSRSLPPKDFTEVVNRLLGICAETTATRNGETDRADSESFRAFFRQTKSGEQHAQAAVHTALALRTRLQSLSEECELKSGCELDARIGISTGEVLLASFGPLKNQRVCVAGEPTEWSRRLACANQLYGSKILVSSQTRQMAESAVELRSIDLLQRALPPEPPEEVFELLALAGTLSPDAQMRLEKYREGVAHLRLRNWTAARICLRKAQPVQSTDDAIDLLVHRINEQEALAGLVLEED